MVHVPPTAKGSNAPDLTPRGTFVLSALAGASGAGEDPLKPAFFQAPTPAPQAHFRKMAQGACLSISADEDDCEGTDSIEVNEDGQLLSPAEYEMRRDNVAPWPDTPEGSFLHANVKDVTTMWPSTPEGHLMPPTPEGHFMPRMRLHDESMAVHRATWEGQMPMQPTVTEVNSPVYTTPQQFEQLPPTASWHSSAASASAPAVQLDPTASWHSSGSWGSQSSAGQATPPNIVEQPQPEAGSRVPGASEWPLLATLPPPKTLSKQANQVGQDVLSKVNPAMIMAPPQQARIQASFAPPHRAREGGEHVSSPESQRSAARSPIMMSMGSTMSYANVPHGDGNAPEDTVGRVTSEQSYDQAWEEGEGQWDSRKKTSIAQLQELLQSPHHTVRFKFPPGVKVLQWSYRQKIDCRLSFRAVLAFLNNGVPYHIAGCWQSCKKHARQSAAETALALVQDQLLQPSEMPEIIDAFVDLSGLLPAPHNEAYRRRASPDYIRRVEAILSHSCGMPVSGESWHCEERGTGYAALLTVQVSGVIYTFGGPALGNADAACAELARRLLWHLKVRQCRGFYLPNRTALLNSGCEAPLAPPIWSDRLGMPAKE